MPFLSKVCLMRARALRRITDCWPGRVIILQRISVTNSPNGSTPRILSGSMSKSQDAPAACGRIADALGRDRDRPPMIDPAD